MTSPIRSATITLALAASLLLAAGCGGGDSAATGSSAAEVAGILPASAPLLVAFETDPESEQWQRADDLLGRFPGRQRLLDEVRKAVAEEGLDLEGDVLPALGDETYLAVLDFEGNGDNVVVLTRPRDPQKLEKLLRESDDPPVTREVEGWTLIAESAELLDRLPEGERLESADWFEEAQGRAEEAALLTFFANGEAIHAAIDEDLPEGCDLTGFGTLTYLAGTVVAEDDGVRVKVAAVGEDVQELVSGESLLSLVPTGAFAYLGSPGFDPTRFALGDQLRCALEEEETVPDVENELGTSYENLIDLFTGGYALYVRPATLIPEITLLLAPEDEKRALQTLDDLAEKLAPLAGGAATREQIDGTEAREINLGPVSVLYGARDGRVVVSTARDGFAALSGDGDKLEEDEGFRDVRDAAGVADGDEIFVYLDLRELVDLVQLVGGLAEEELPKEVEENLEPLGGFIAWGDLSDPNDVEGGAFLEIR
jgi:Protein of unknown function (DUF3352)